MKDKKVKVEEEEEDEREKGERMKEEVKKRWRSYEVNSFHVRV